MTGTGKDGNHGIVIQLRVVYEQNLRILLLDLCAERNKIRDDCALEERSMCVHVHKAI